MEKSSRNVAAILRRFTMGHHGLSKSNITRRDSLVKRRLGDGAIAGISVGSIVFCALLCLCLYPVIVGTLKRRKRRKHREKHPHFDPEGGGTTANGFPAANTEDFDRRLSSADSVKPNDNSSRGELAPPDGKDHDQRNLPVDPGGQQTWGSQMVQGSVNSPATHMSGQDLAQHVGDGQMTPFPTYDGGVYYPGADPSEPRGANADYYSPSIPSEAFGMYTMPSPTEQSESSKVRLRGSSLRNSVKGLLRRASGRERTTSSTTSGDADTAGASGVTSLQTLFANQNPTDSPTEMSPATSSPPPGSLPPNSQAFGTFSRGLGEEDHTQIQPPTERSFRCSPPLNPGPGTVNPMDIMPPASEPEKWHRTDHELYLATHQPPSASVSPTAPSNAQFSPAANSMPPSSSPPTLPLHFGEPTRHDTDQTIKQEYSHQQPQDVEMDNAPSQDYLHPEPDPGRHFSYPSDQSTPFPGLASTNPSSHNTPTTSQTDTPSPESSGIQSDFRHSASPAASNPSPRHAPGHYACTVPDCGQVFDQHHKLNHHARYHAKQHRCEYPNCGKGFGTKTHLQRHINDRHLHTKKFHCAVPNCEYSRSGGKSFLRKDNWKRHMTRIHHVESRDLPEPVEYEEMVDS